MGCFADLRIKSVRNIAVELAWLGTQQVRVLAGLW